MNGKGEMTLALELDSLFRLADPGAAVREAQPWVASVGIVSDEAPDRIASVADRYGVSPDFTGSVTGESDGLSVVRRQYVAARYVFVGSSDDDREAARALGWEYIDVAAAAEKADWARASTDGRWRADSADSESSVDR